MFEGFQSDVHYLSELTGQEVGQCGAFTRLSAATSDRNSDFIRHWEVADSDGFSTKFGPGYQFGIICFPSHDRGLVRICLDISLGERLAVWIKASHAALEGEFIFSAQESGKHLFGPLYADYDDRYEMNLFISPKYLGQHGTIELDFRLSDVDPDCETPIWNLMYCDIAKVR